MHHIGEISLLGARGMMAGEVTALRHHVWEMLDSQAGRFHMRFVCIVARKAERAYIATVRCEPWKRWPCGAEKVEQDEGRRGRLLQGTRCCLELLEGVRP
jgi:hypothetical protein